MLDKNLASEHYRDGRNLLKVATAFFYAFVSQNVACNFHVSIISSTDFGN